MALAVDTRVHDIDIFSVDHSMVEEYVTRLWGTRAGVNSPRSSGLRVHPSTASSASWLHALWGFAV